VQRNLKSVRIGRNLEHVTISLSDPSPDPESDTPLARRGLYDANWIPARIEITAGGFRGSDHASLLREDFPDFRDALFSLHSFASNEGQFRTIENQLRINIRGDRRGNFAADCVARDTTDGNCLEFKLRFDQTDIPRMMTELDTIIEAYPVLGKPGT
jgi:hypothetical protein